MALNLATSSCKAIENTKQKKALRCVTIITKEKAFSVIPKLVDSHSLCYYLIDDYAHLTDLRDKLRDKIEIRNLSEIFQETFQEIKKPFLELIANLNKEYDSLEWWGGELASRSTTSTPLLLNITYLFCAKKIISNSGESITFIVNSMALSECITNVAMNAGYQVEKYGSKTNEYAGIIRRWLYYTAQILYYLWRSLQNRRAAFKLLKPPPNKKTHAKKRIVIRSWITEGSFDKSGKFKDRNFGPLPEWLHAKNYEVWNLPMFFNLSMSIKEVYTLMKNQEQLFLIPDHYLKFSDYLRVLYSGYQTFRKKMKNVVIKGTNVTSLFNEVLREQGFFPSLLILNLCFPLLERLKGHGVEIDAFYYPFEGNIPEKTFILSCRKYFPDSKIIGFQHTAFFPNQLACHLGPDEKDYHPLPDELVCSGPIYIKLLEGAGFPSEILEAGPNLRFGYVYTNKANIRDVMTNEEKMLMLPLTFSHDLAFELFVKVKDALEGVQEDYKVYIRSHPLLSKKALTKFLDKIGIDNYEFADDGIIQEWLPKLHAVISAGCSITILESVIIGTPVIRVIPDNTFFYDPFIWTDYPLKPVNTSLEVKRQLQLIDEILDKDKEVFLNIGKQVLTEYFTKPTEENMRVFL